MTRFVQLPLCNRDEEIVVQDVQLRSRIELWLHVRLQFVNRSKLQVQVGYAWPGLSYLQANINLSLRCLSEAEL